MVTVGYYTTDPLYHSCYQLLEKSFNKRGLSYDYKAIEPSDWQSVISLKPKIILSMLKKYKEPVLYLDADAFVHANYAEFFESLDCDLSVYYLMKKNGEEELLSGTLYFDYSVKTIELVERWIEEVDKNPALNDQECLAITLKMYGSHLKIEPLPLAYIYIFDREYKGQQVIPVIEHLQASREVNLSRQLQGFKYRVLSRLGISSNKQRRLNQRLARIEQIQASLER